MPKFVPTKEQKDAIEHKEGHLQIIACPGSGKTEVVSRRVAELIKNGEDPETIVSFTFTEKAADELKSRIRRVLEDECSNRADFGDMYVGTIHGYCAHLLKEIEPRYRSYDVLDESMRIAFLNRYDNFYDRLHLNLLKDYYNIPHYKTIDRFLQSADIMMTEDVELDSMADTEENNLFKESYKKYREVLNEDRYFDFSSIMETLVKTLQSDPKKLEKATEIVKHVTVDEYQDVNTMQEMLVELLSKGAKSVCVVGDDDQNIYHWRGSNVSFIRNFEQKYATLGYNVQKVPLEINYRSTPQIISTCKGFIENNTLRLDKQMVSSKNLKRPYDDGDIVYNHFDTEQNEFNFIVEKIRELEGADFVNKQNSSRSISLGNIAVLVRSNWDAARLIEHLDNNQIDSVAYSGQSVFTRNEVKLAMDCISYVFACRGFTKDDIPTLDELVARYPDVFRRSIFPNADADKFSEKLSRIKEMAEAKLAESPRDYLGGLGLQEYYHNILNAMGAEDFDFGNVYNYNFAVLSDAISDYELVYKRLRASQVIGFVFFVLSFVQSKYVETIHNDPTIQNAVNVLTIHKAKGLEFPVVFMPCFIKGRERRKNETFVDERLYNSAMYLGDTEDDRRMYYTAMTRSEKHLFITGATFRGTGPRERRKKPHPLIDEIPHQYFSNRLRLKYEKNDFPPMLIEDGIFSTSFSHLGSYERCPKDFQLRHIFGYNAGVPPGFGYGTNLHNMLNVIFHDYQENNTVPTEKDVEKMFDDMFKLRYATKIMSDNMRKKAEEIIKKYVRLHQGTFDRVLKTEKNFEFVIGPATISGQIDLLLSVDKQNKVRDVEIIDFKSEEKTDGEYQADHEKQLRYYAIACIDSLGYVPKTALVHHLSENDPSKMKTSVDISKSELDATRKSIGHQVKNVLGRKFTAKPKNNVDTCNECDYKRICSMKSFKSGITIKKPKTVKAVTGSTATNTIPKNPPLGAATMAKARALAKKVVQTGNNTFEVPSSKNGVYSIADGRCTCKGYKYFYKNHEGVPTCSHLQAVRFYKESERS